VLLGEIYLCLTVCVIHKNSLLLSQNNGDDAPQNRNQQISILVRTTLNIPAETNSRQARLRKFQEATNSSSVNRDIPSTMWKLKIHYRRNNSLLFLLFHTVHLLLFCTMTNKCTIISQIITLLHVSTLSCHPQGACNQYIAKLPKYFKCSCW